MGLDSIRRESSYFCGRQAEGHVRMDSIRMRVRHSYRRLFRRCSVEQRRSPGRGSHGRRRKILRHLGIIKLSFVVTIVISFTLGLIFLKRRRDGSDEYMESMRNIYEQATRDGAGEETDSLNMENERGGTPDLRYDPRARAYLERDSHLWGDEAQKGKDKRHLFMQVHKMSTTKGRPQLKLNELMALPSTFDPSRTPLSDTTIILNHWKRTTLSDQLDAILRQTVRPAGGVWVCLFDSPRESEYKAIIDKYRDYFKDLGGLYFVSSSFNFKYYGRFQLALQAKTRYVWIVDDDVMPGNKFLQQLTHIAGIPGAVTEGEQGIDGDKSIGPMALGSVGWVMPGPKPSSGQFYSYRYRTDKGGLYLPDKRYGIFVPHLQEVDLLCSHWFLETDWVRLVFRERWETSETGEDYMLAYSLRKYAGVRSYVVPMDLTDSETWGNTDVEWAMQSQGGFATTSGRMVQTRDRLWHRLFKRGGEYFLSTQYAQDPRPILLLVDNTMDAEMLRSLYAELETSAALADVDKNSSLRSPKPRPPRVVLTGRGGGAGCLTAAVAFGIAKDKRRAADLSFCKADDFRGAWNLHAGRHFPRDGAEKSSGRGGGDHVLMGDVASGLQGVVRTIRPLAIVSIASARQGATGTVTTQERMAIDDAVSAVSTLNRVPWIQFPRVKDSSAAALWLGQLAPEAFEYWGSVKIDILVLHDPRVDGGSAGRGHTEAQLEALLDSLLAANYLGDSVKLTVAGSAGSAPESVTSLAWDHGTKVVRDSLRTPAPVADGGISMVALGLRSWVPQSIDNFVVVLEADLVVSTLFYSWLKVAVLEANYARTSSAQHLARAVGLSTSVRGDTSQAYRTWLFPPGHWRYMQATCLTASSSEECERNAFTRQPENSESPSLEGRHISLVAQTDSDGEVRNPRGGFTEDPRDVVRLHHGAFLMRS